MKLRGTVTLTLAFVVLCIFGPTSSASVNSVTFRSGTSSTGWINFDFYNGDHIFVPAKINGHDTTVMLVTGLPVASIDKAFAASIGLRPTGGSTASAVGHDATSGLLGGLQIQIGDLTLQDTAASVVDFTPLARHFGHTVPFLLGDDVFDKLAVDIDFVQHRIAFRDPASQTKPAGAVEVPLLKVEDQHVVPVSIEDAAPAQFAFGLGNSSEMLVYQSYYQAHKLLEGRRTSQRGGSGGFQPESVATLNHASFAGIEVFKMPAAFITAAQAGPVSDQISGNVGLPLLARFRLIIDYSHHRLYAIPYNGASSKPFDKDRIGLALTKEDTRLVVGFVAPDSPAQTAGFKIGEKIAMINGKPVREWPQTALAKLKYGVSGTNLVFTMEGGSIRQVKMADYF